MIEGMKIAKMHMKAQSEFFVTVKVVPYSVIFNSLNVMFLMVSLIWMISDIMYHVHLIISHDLVIGFVYYIQIPFLMVHSLYLIVNS